MTLLPDIFGAVCWLRRSMAGLCVFQMVYKLKDLSKGCTHVKYGLLLPERHREESTPRGLISLKPSFLKYTHRYFIMADELVCIAEEGVLSEEAEKALAATAGVALRRGHTGGLVSQFRAS